MGHSQEDKARSRERIVSAAARRIRQAGLSALSIADIMREARLTHGGFYGHFDSRTDLLAAALEAALRESKVVWGAPNARRTLAGVVTKYLSRSHRDTPDSGCAVAALASEVARADDKTRAVMDAHLKRYVENVTALLDESADPELAIPIVCTMLGALTLSRLVDDAHLSDKVLNDSRKFILAVAREDQGNAAIR